MLNDIRAAKIPPQTLVSWSAVENFILNSPAVLRSKRQMQKSGSSDEGKGWTVGRLAQCRQLVYQYQMGLVYTLADPTLENEMKVIRYWLVAWYDEKHLKVRLGHASKR